MGHVQWHIFSTIYFIEIMIRPKNVQLTVHAIIFNFEFISDDVCNFTYDCHVVISSSVITSQPFVISIVYDY